MKRKTKTEKAIIWVTEKHPYTLIILAIVLGAIAGLIFAICNERVI